MSEHKNKLIYYLPLEQTVYQKCLIDIILELHRPHLLKYLECHKNLEFDTLSNNGQGDEMSNESMMEAFIFNITQIINHPTLLVDHYIPRNLLLLNSKENVITLSNKYSKVSEILDKLVERDVKKTIIISVSNAKEMDLVESFLLGKCGLQYYRFSGSSLYYDNHGSFDFHKATNTEVLKSDDVAPNASEYASSSSSTPPPTEPKKRRQGRSKKATPTTTTKEKKKSGRPSNAEKKNRESVEAELNATTNSNKRDREEYIPRVSKNSEKYLQMIQERKNKRLNVYLILSSQLKYLVQFEDLRSDLIISLDSQTNNYDDLSSIIGHQVPIIKPVIVESLEHYEAELRTDSGVIYDDNQTLRNQRNINKDKSHKKVEFNRLLSLLTVAAWPNVKMNLPSELSPISNDFIDWLINPMELKYPYSQTIETQLPLILNKKLITQVSNTLSNLSENNVLQKAKIEQYAFFNSKYDIKEESNVNHENKRLKTSPKHEDIPDTFNYSQYQLYLTKLINDSYVSMQGWITNTESKLRFVHLDETERQYVIDKGNADSGEYYKKDRDLSVLIEGRTKMKEKLAAEFSKIDTIRKDLKVRLDGYQDLNGTSFSMNKQEEEIAQLRRRLDELKLDLSKADNETNDIRKLYQEKSSTAAELSAYAKSLEETEKELKGKSAGVFRNIQLQGIEEKQDFVDKKIREHSNNIKMWKGFLESLRTQVEKRSSTAAVSGSRIARSSRNNTPY